MAVIGTDALQEPDVEEIFGTLEAHLDEYFTRADERLSMW